MPRIRKKTSNRGTTHQRSKIKHKVAESRKKAKKAAKKNPQWKSKHEKDPGIPNNFPYKEQILAEVAEQRRQAAEEKQKRKESKKAAVSTATEEDEPIVIDGVTSVAGCANTSAAQSRNKKDNSVTEDREATDGLPSLEQSEFKSLQTVLDNSDIILYMLDARDPLAFQNKHLLRHISTKKRSKLIMLLNKIDLCPRESVQDWLIELRRRYTVLPVRSASAFLPEKPLHLSKGSSTSEQKKSRKDAAGRSTLLAALVNEAAQKNKDTLTVALVGVANTGKSSLINSLLCRPICPSYQLSSTPTGPSTTTLAQEVTLSHEGKMFRFIDTPALSWAAVQDTDEDDAARLRARDVLLRNKGRIDKVKDPVLAVAQIIPRAKTEDLMVFYNLPAFTHGDDAAFLTALARSQRMSKKGGVPDLQSAARVVLRDWSVNKLPWYSVPSTASSPSPNDGNANHAYNSEYAFLYEADQASLEASPTRKEMRQGVGLVRLTPELAEAREVQLDAEWGVEESGEESDDEAMGVDDEEYDETASGNGSGHGGSEVCGEDEGDENTSEDDDGVPTLLSPRRTSVNGKRKRLMQPENAPTPKKKVEFVPSTRTTVKKPVTSSKLSKPLRKRK